jgi:hypothetical protein
MSLELGKTYLVELDDAGEGLGLIHIVRGPFQNSIEAEECLSEEAKFFATKDLYHTIRVQTAISVQKVEKIVITRLNKKVLDKMKDRLKEKKKGKENESSTDKS